MHQSCIHRNGILRYPTLKLHANNCHISMNKNWLLRYVSKSLVCMSMCYQKWNELNVLEFDVFREMRILRTLFVFLYTVSEKDYFSQQQKRWQKELSKLEESIGTPFFGLLTENNLSLHRIE